MANSLEKEYKKALLRMADIKNELALLPFGYISEKTINGTKQYYLQKRVGNKVLGKHISSAELSSVRLGLSKRESFEKELAAIEERLVNVEAAAKLVSHNLYKKILLLKDCMPMESLSTDARVRASSFAEAMNAIEGIPASAEIRSDIKAWHLGEVSFLSLYEATLKKYGFPVDVR